MEKVIVSFTSYPERIGTVNKVLDSIVDQTVQADKIILYLSKSEFRDFGDIPDFEKYKKYGFEIHWCEENLRSHKKWFYAFQEYPDDVIITIDDDILYRGTMLETLLGYHERFPECVIARRVHLITCNDDNSVASYDDWYKECNAYTDVPRMDLFATTGAGTLFPPHVFSSELFNKDVFMKLCPFADDIWMKVLEVYSGIPVVLAEKFWNDTVLVEHQKCCLYENHNRNGGNDTQLKAVLKEYPYTCQKEKLVDCIFGADRISCREAEVIEGKEMQKVLIELKKRLEDYEELLVYGAGEIGSRIFHLLSESAAEVIKAFVVNRLTENVNMIENISVENYRDYINSNEKIVIALYDNNTAEKVRLELINKGINADRIIMLRGYEKRALMKKVQISF